VPTADPRLIVTSTRVNGERAAMPFSHGRKPA
jgi:hypothetical protein